MFKNAQWAVTDYGLEAEPPNAPYEISKRSLTLESHRGDETFYNWPVHVAEKSWVDINAFNEAFDKALKEHKGHYVPEVDPKMLAKSFAEACLIAAESAGRATAGETVVRSKGRVSGRLVANPNYRISLSDPEVKSQHTESKAKLEVLLQKLNSFHGEDLEPDEVNTEQVPITQDELNLLRSTVEAAIAIHRAPSISDQVIHALKNLFDYLASMQGTVKALGIAGLLTALTLAVEALKAFLVALGAL